MRKLFYWDEDTINHFKFQNAFYSKDEFLKEVTSFVENSCDIEFGETEEMLIKDLINQIQNK